MGRSLPLLVALAAVAAAGADRALVVRASPAVAPCAAAAADAFRSVTGRAVSVETARLGEPASVAGADVVVAADTELHRIIESGASHPDLDVDVARIPWVLASAPGAPAPQLSSLARTTTPVRMLGGAVARDALRNLSRQGLAPGNARRVDGTDGPLRLAPGEAAIVPLSLAGPGPVSSLPVPPITARALGVRASPRPAAARAFLDFLGRAGNEAFRACGRPETQ